MNYLGRLQIVNVRFMDIQQVQAVCTQASQVSHKVMQSWAECTQVSTEYRWHISIHHHIMNLYHITHGNSDRFYVTTAKHKIKQMKHMLYRCTTLQQRVWSHCGNDGSQITLPCSAV